MQSKETRISPTWFFSSPEPDFGPDYCRHFRPEQAGIGRVGGRATADHAIQDGQAALQVPQQRPVHAREITYPGSERFPFGLQPGGMRGFQGFARCASRQLRRTPPGLATKVVFKPAPLPAKLRLMRRTARDRFRVVAYQRQGARLQARRQAAQERHPLVDQLA